MNKRPLILIVFAGLTFFVCPAKAQETCGLRVAAYYEGDSLSGVVGKGHLDGAPLSGISAYAEGWRSKKRFNSVPIGKARFFGDMSEGDYRIFVGRAGYKTTVYGFHLSCSEAVQGLVTQSIRLWRGKPVQVVNKAPGTPQKPQMRVDRLTVIGSTDSDTGGGVEPNREGKQPFERSQRTISGGVLNGKAASLPKPVYPPAARAVRAGGSVAVAVLIDESGQVVSANAVSGHPLLTAASEEAARKARFSPTLLEGRPVKVSGIITYNFVP